MVHRFAPQARAELNNIWNYIARESGNLAAADGVIDTITERFYLLAEFPYIWVALATICNPDCAAFRSGST
jgi:plasmid stabilization system protein ParE